MIIFLFGEDAFRRDRKKKEIIAQFLAKNPRSGLGIFRMDEDGSDLKLKDFLEQASLFAPKKLAVMESFEEAPFKKDFYAPFFINSATTLLITGDKKPGKPLGLLLEAPAKSEEFTFLEGIPWNNFILREAKRLGLEIDAPALKFLAALYRKDTWRAVMELEKLATFKKQINLKTLESLALEASPDYWSMVQGVRGRSLKDRLSNFYWLLEHNEPAAKMFNILGALWYEKKPQFAAGDIKVKSGKLEYEEVLLDAILTPGQ